MKTSFLLPACFAATLFLGPGLRAATAATTTADPADDSSLHQPSPARQAELLRLYDKNGDGKLDDTEKAAAKLDMQKRGSDRKAKVHERALSLYDKNGDGKLDESEQAAALADLKTRPNVIKRFDKDGDGKLNAEESAAADAALRHRLAHHNKEAATPASK